MIKENIVIKAAISCIILIAIVNFIGLKKTLEAGLEAKIEYIALVILFFLVSTMFTALAVMPLLKTKEFYRIFKFKAISWSTGMFLPGKIGEASFVPMLKNTGISTKKALAIFFIDRFVSLSIIGIIGFFGFAKYFGMKIDLNYFIAFFLILVILFTAKNKIQKIKIIEKQIALLQEAKEYLKQEKKAIALNYFFSAINFLVMFWVTQIIFYSIGEKVGLIDVALISSIAIIVSLVPITINGLGLREGTLIYLYSLAGIRPESTALMAIVFLVSSYSIAGIFLSAYYNEFSFILKKKEAQNG